MRKALEHASGGVLVLDEAYTVLPSTARPRGCKYKTLFGDDYGQSPVPVNASFLLQAEYIKAHDTHIEGHGDI